MYKCGRQIMLNTLVFSMLFLEKVMFSKWNTNYYVSLLYVDFWTSQAKLSTAVQYIWLTIIFK